MSLSRKKSRKISIDGHDYRWVFSPDSGYFNVIVQIADGAGARLEAQSSSDWVNYGDAQISPGIVEKLIRLAIEDGWEPTERGVPFSVRSFDKRLGIGAKLPSRADNRI